MTSGIWVRLRLGIMQANLTTRTRRCTKFKHRTLNRPWYRFRADSVSLIPSKLKYAKSGKSSARLWRGSDASPVAILQSLHCGQKAGKFNLSPINQARLFHDISVSVLIQRHSTATTPRISTWLLFMTGTRCLSSWWRLMAARTKQPKDWVEDSG